MSKHFDGETLRYSTTPAPLSTLGMFLVLSSVRVRVACDPRLDDDPATWRWCNTTDRCLRLLHELMTIEQHDLCAAIWIETMEAVDDVLSRVW